MKKRPPKSLTLSLHSIMYSSDVITRFMTIATNNKNILPIETATLARLYIIGGKMTLKDLSYGIFRSPNATSTLVRKLEKAGLVRKEVNTNDRRYQYIYLTDKGRKLYLEIEPLLKEAAQFILGDLSQENIEILVDTLRQIRKKLMVKTGLPSEWFKKHNDVYFST